MPSHKILRIFPSDVLTRQLLRKELSISPILSQILINRGMNSVEAANEFLNINTEKLLDPYSFREMQKAVSIVKRCAELKQKVLVFGDYDVDGITSVALLKDTLNRCGVECIHHLPHRIKDGYGLCKDIVQLAKKNNVKLVITADCGISNYKEIEGLRREGIDVIVTDHHESRSEALPCASSIINPKLKDSNYGFRDLAGVGVAFKFAQALSGSKLFEDLDLVALGTIADNAPLTGENRIVAKQGLLRLSNTRRPGLRALIENAGIENRKFTSTSVSFIIAPRLNASGRIDTAETSLKLL
ncbi:MAG: DHH family phosphoesterase, partial [Candidatus Omnitrophica bacterium]|nr:DHH family phosphoesterase [Candidatus Omnitrophota bacterium]